MINKKEKIFDSVKMVREIREAMFKNATDPHFDKKEFEMIKKKWTNLINKQEKTGYVKSSL